MLTINNHKQMELFDPWSFLSPKRRQKLDEDWPGLFKKHLLEELPVNELAPYYKEDGRPGKELYSLLGALLLQQVLDLTDQETSRQFAYDIQWHYALNITEESDQAKYICEKTLWTWRQILLENNLHDLIFDNVTGKLASVFNVNTDKQRIDSTHIKSNMRKLGRIGIFSKTIQKFLKHLEKAHKPLYETVRQEIIERYMSKDSSAAFSMIKPNQSAKTLKQLSRDLYDLVIQFKGHRDVNKMHEFKLMQRVLKEQCNLNSDDTGSKIGVKPPKEIPSDSLQNPSDPDTTYSGHKGQGYQVQIMETYTQTEDENEKDETLNLITHVSVERACEHDSDALIPAICDVKEKGLTPEEVLGDSLYGTDDNITAAEKMGVEVVAPALGSGYKGIGLTEFEFDENGYVAKCPTGKKPQTVRYKKKTDRFNIRFDKEDCRDCPLYAECPAKKNKKFNMLSYSKKAWRMALRRSIEKTKEFIDKYRWRAGVEATMSEYKTRTGVKRLRVRGMKKVRFCAKLKAVGVNIMRAALVRKARRRANGGRYCRILHIFMPILIFKEQICKIKSVNNINNIWRHAADDFYAKSAA